MASTAGTFVGLVALRIAFGFMAIFVAAFGTWVALTAENDGSTREMAGAASFAGFSTLAGFAGVAVALERVVVDGDGVHRRNPIWRDRSTPWAEVGAARVETDQYNTHPVIETLDGRAIRLRGASSLSDAPTSTAQRTVAAISAFLDEQH